MLVKFYTKIQPLNIVGRVCMNHTMIDVSGANIKVGSEVIMISSDKTKPNSVTELVKNHNLFSYGLVTNLASSVKRIIVP